MSPIAFDSSYEMLANEKLNGKLNATDENGDVLSYTIVSNPSHGTVTITNAADGKFNYTPAANYVGGDAFTFKVSDGSLESAAATVSINVSANTKGLLSSLSLSSGALNPVFVPSTTSYTQDVVNSVSSVTVTPISADATASVTVNGITVASSQASAAIPLNVGANTITVEVTATDSTKLTYTITITRASEGVGGGGVFIPTPSTDTKVTSTDGKLTLPVGKSGEVSLGDAIILSIPANASDKELKVTIDKVTDASPLLTNNEVLLSPSI